LLRWFGLGSVGLCEFRLDLFCWVTLS